MIKLQRQDLCPKEVGINLLILFVEGNYVHLEAFDNVKTLT